LLCYPPHLLVLATEALDIHTIHTIHTPFTVLCNERSLIIPNLTSNPDTRALSLYKSIMARLQLLLLAAASFLSLCHGQASGWEAGQINATMCYWQQLRSTAIPPSPSISMPSSIFLRTDPMVAAVIRDAVYIDGGLLYWLRGMNDSTYSDPSNDGMASLRTLVYIIYADSSR
jgi:hypothetical protein